VAPHDQNHGLEDYITGRATSHREAQADHVSQLLLYHLTEDS